MFPPVVLLAAIAAPDPALTAASTSASDLLAPAPNRTLAATPLPDSADWAAAPRTRRYRFTVAQEEGLEPEPVDIPQPPALDVEEEDLPSLEELEDLDDLSTPAPTTLPDVEAIDLSEPVTPAGDDPDLENSDDPEGPQNSDSSEIIAPLPIETPTETFTVTADHQEFDAERNVVTAEGSVLIRYPQGTIEADRVRVNLTTRFAVATGNVVVMRGQQVFRGDRLEYSFVQETGRLIAANGEIFQPTANRDFSLSSDMRSDRSLDGIPQPRTLTNTIVDDARVTDITAGTGFAFGTGVDTDGAVGSNNANQPVAGFNRLRFQADVLDLDRDGFRGTNARITNDPFNPPELELRAETFVFRQIDPERDEIVTTKSRAVFDGNTAIPLFRNRIVLDRRDRPAGLFNIGFDDDDRGGLFIDRSFTLVENDRFRLRITPQLFVQRAIEGDGDAADYVGAIGELDWLIARRTAFRAESSWLTLDPEPTPPSRGGDDEESPDRRARINLRQLIGTRRPHTLDVTYSLQERIFNGSLGFQDVDESFGATLLSPQYRFGNTGITLRYQADVQRVSADTTDPEFLDPGERVTLATLTRYQGALVAGWSRFLWRGKPLPATPEEGLRYTPTPVVPNLLFFLGAQGVLSEYSNGDSQNLISGTVGLRGQIGHFARRAFSFTAFSVSYTNGAVSGLSPFLFDRAADRERITFGLTQQLFGPFRAGVVTSFNLETNEEISTSYLLEYSRRTYNIAIRANPQLGTGSLQLRINAFNWRGTPGPLEQNAIQTVTDGVRR